MKAVTSSSTHRIDHKRLMVKTLKYDNPNSETKFNKLKYKGYKYRAN